MFAVSKEKQPYAKPVHWCPTGYVDLTDPEMLFCAFTIAAKGFDTAKEANQWAGKVWLDRSAAFQLKSEWKPAVGGEAGWGEVKKCSTSALFNPMKRALKATWHEHELEAIGIQMQLWRGDGQFDGVRKGQLKEYIKKQPLGVQLSKKTEPLPRWRTWSIVRIAEVVLKRGAEMRKLLKLDMAPDFVITAAERIEALEKRNRQLEEQVAAANVTAAKASDAHRKAAGRLKADKRKEREARKQEVQRRIDAAVARQKATADTKVAAAQKAAEAVQATAMEIAEGQVADRVAELAGQVSVARKRARDVEGQAKDAVRNLERAQDAEHELDAAKSKIDDFFEVLGAAKAAKTKYLAVCEKVDSMPTWRRRRGKGRGKGAAKLEPYYEIAMWEQHANGTPPSAIGKNIVSVIKITAPWLDPIEPTQPKIRENR